MAHQTSKMLPKLSTPHSIGRLMDADLFHVQVRIRPKQLSGVLPQAAQVGATRVAAPAVTGPLADVTYWN
jgi:hypothetical protein